MILNISNIIIYNLFISKLFYLLSSFEKIRTSGGGFADVCGEGEGSKLAENLPTSFTDGPEVIWPRSKTRPANW